METEEEQDIMSIVEAVKIPLKCDSCEFSTFWPRSLECHRMIHAGKYLYKCKQCNFSTRHKSSLRRHDRNQHFDFIAAMTIADNEILEFLSQDLISTPQPCNQSTESPIRDTINYIGTANNTENERSSSYTNNNFQHGISGRTVTSSNYQDEVSSSIVSKNIQTGTSNIFGNNNCENVISSSIALNNYQGGSFFINNINNFQNEISSSVDNSNFQNEIGRHFVRNSCKSVISSSVVSNNYQRTSSSCFINNVNNFQNGISSSYIKDNNCVNELTSTTLSNNFQHGISSISANSNYENVISSSAASSNYYQNTRKNSGSFVSNMSTNYVENFDETLSTESLSRPKPPSLGNELSPGNNIILFVCELCGFECSSADVCYNHAAEHQTNVFSPSWVAACADVL